jgi:hypothetical protein
MHMGAGGSRRADDGMVHANPLGVAQPPDDYRGNSTNNIDEMLHPRVVVWVTWQVTELILMERRPEVSYSPLLAGEAEDHDWIQLVRIFTFCMCDWSARVMFRLERMIAKWLISTRVALSMLSTITYICNFRK